MMDIVRMQEMARAEADEQDQMKEQPFLIYVAGPINGDAERYIKNIRHMTDYATQIEELISKKKLDGTAHNPSLDFLQGYSQKDRTYKQYMKSNGVYLRLSKALALVPEWIDDNRELVSWKNSNGTKEEILIAHTLNIPILHDLDEVKQFLGV